METEAPRLNDSDTEKRFLTISEIAKQAVKDSNLPERTPLNNSTNLRWQMSYQIQNKDVVVSIAFNSPITRGIANYSLGCVAMVVFDTITELFSDQKAKDFFDISEDEIDDEIFLQSVRLVNWFVSQMPISLFNSIHQSLSESTVSYVKKIVEYDLQDFYREKNVNSDSNLLPSNELADIKRLFPNVNLPLISLLREIEEEFSSYRKGSFSNRKAWLNQDASKTLPDRYEELRQKYALAKKEFKKKKEAFYEINRKATSEDWKTFWTNYSEQEFPELFLLDEFMQDLPSDFAYRQLAKFFGFSKDYMVKLIQNSRKQTKQNKSIQKNMDK